MNFPERSQKLVKADSKEKDTLQKEYKFLTALSQLGLNNLLEAVKNKEVNLSPKDLQILAQMRQVASREDLDSVDIHFKQCNSCIFDKSCHLYEPNSDCKFDIGAPIENPTDTIGVMKKLMQIQADRLMRGFLVEKAEGNSIDAAVSSEMSLYFEMAEKLKSILEVEAKLTITAKGPSVLQEMFKDFLPTETKKPDSFIEIPSEKEDSETPITHKAPE